MRNVVILGMPRSGSSMIAGIFARHKFWTGRCRLGDELNPTGYYENLDVKRWMIDHYGRRAQMTNPDMAYAPGIDALMARLKPTEPWCIKHSAMYWRAWEKFEPRPLFIGTIRGFEGFCASNLKTGFLDTQDRERIREIYAAHLTCMQRAGALPVYTDDVVKGEHARLKEALEQAGADPHPVKIAAHISPMHWHHESPDRISEAGAAFSE